MNTPSTMNGRRHLQESTRGPERPIPAKHDSTNQPAPGRGDVPGTTGKAAGQGYAQASDATRQPKRPVAFPVVLRWCKGICGRERPLQDFLFDGKGHREYKCRTCRRFRKRQRYRSYAAVRRRLLKAHCRWYAENAAAVCAHEKARYWANRDAILKAKRDAYWRRKKAA